MRLIAPTIALCLSACAGTANMPKPAADTCQAEAGQAFIGQTASIAVGTDLLTATHSREIRWVPPGTVVTMEYKFGRLTVGYDDAMRITAISCG